MKHIIKAYSHFPIPYRFLWIGALIGVIIDLSQNYAFHLSMRNEYAFSWFLMSVRFSAFYIVWIFLAPIMYEVAERHTDIFQAGSKKSLLRWIGWSLVISFVHLVMYSFLFDLLMYFKNGVFPNWLEFSLLIRIAAGYFASITYYLLIAAILFFHIYLIRYLRKEKELTQAKLNALIMQLRPHFLFNTLHSINTLIDMDSKAAQSMVTKLGNLLRKVIQSDANHLITFEEELSFIKNYLDIEQVRFQDRLQIHYSVDPDTMQAMVPKLILQPLVENAIKHGIGKLTDHALIHISSQLIYSDQDSKTCLQVTIQDNGPGFEKVDFQSNKSGIGLKNVASRLQQHYGEDGKFLIDSKPGQGAAIQIKIPFEKTANTLTKY